MLSEKDMKDVFPHYKENKYKGIITEPGIHILSKGLSQAYVIEIDIQEAMRETQRKYRIIRKWDDGAMVYLEYEAFK